MIVRVPAVVEDAAYRLVPMCLHFRLTCSVVRAARPVGRADDALLSHALANDSSHGTKLQPLESPPFSHSKKKGDCVHIHIDERRISS